MSNQINDGGPAFPCEVKQGMHGAHQVGPDTFLVHGMTLRDYFAAKALQGWLASYAGFNAPHPANDGTADVIARQSYAIADAMLAARSECVVRHA